MDGMLCSRLALLSCCNFVCSGKFNKFIRIPIALSDNAGDYSDEVSGLSHQ